MTPEEFVEAVERVSRVTVVVEIDRQTSMEEARSRSLCVSIERSRRRSKHDERFPCRG